MAESQTFDFDIEALLQPISDESPSGENLEFDSVYNQIEEARKEDEGLSQGVWETEQQVADWPAVIRLATEALTDRSKDLRICIWLTEAWIHQDGFMGLLNGLSLLRELQDRFWDSFYPVIEEQEQGDTDDGEADAAERDAEYDEDQLLERIGVLGRCNGDLSLAVRQIPITREEGYSWLRWQESRTMDNLSRQDQEAFQQEREVGKITGEEFDTAVAAAPRAYYEPIFAALTQSVEASEQLDQLVRTRYGKHAPSLRGMKEALEECHTLVEGIVRKKREEEPGEDLPETGDEGEANRIGDGASEVGSTAPHANGPTQAGSFPLEPRDRPDALRRLEAVAAFFRRTEPHSPISYLVQRAARWGAMPLEEWLQEVIRDDSVLSQLRDTLGLKEPDQDM